MTIASLEGDRKRNIVGKIRIGELNRFYRGRYGDVFPDDDAGHEDLEILLHHYALNKPDAIPRVIELRAPWMTEQHAAELTEEINDNPRRWLAGELGRVLGLTGAEWRRRPYKTIAPIDMTLDERRGILAAAGQ
jgi:hypothetical protein